MKTLPLTSFLALRNVVRYKRRNLGTFSILFCGALCIMLVDAFMTGFARDTRERLVASCGHVDAHAPGYLESAEASPLDLCVPEAGAALATMLRAAASVSDRRSVCVAAASLTTGGLVSDGEKSSQALIIGVEAFALDSFGARAVPNPFLRGLAASIVDGKPFGKGFERGAIIDEKTALKLSLRPGSRAILLLSDPWGSFSMGEIEVLGIARNGSLPLGCQGLCDLESLQAILGMEGQASSLSLWFAGSGGINGDGQPVLLGPHAGKRASEAAIAAASGMGLKARGFAEISGTYAAMLEFLDWFMAGMMAVFALVAGVGVANAVLLSVQDRAKDMGTLRAIAFGPRDAGIMVGIETLIVGCAAATAAFLLGTASVAVLAKLGISLRMAYESNGAGLAQSLRPILDPARLGTIAVLSATFPLLAAYGPIRGIKRMTVRESFA